MSLVTLIQEAGLRGVQGPIQQQPSLQPSLPRLIDALDRSWAVGCWLPVHRAPAHSCSLTLNPPVILQSGARWPVSPSRPQQRTKLARGPWSSFSCLVLSLLFGLAPSSSSRISLALPPSSARVRPPKGTNNELLGMPGHCRGLGREEGPPSPLNSRGNFPLTRPSSHHEPMTHPLRVLSSSPP